MSLRKTLQTDVFSAQEERLLHAIHVIRASKRKKHALLCITANSEGNQIFIHKIKKLEKNEAFKKVGYWPLTHLKKVDGHSSISDAPSLQFDIYFEKAFMWECESMLEKDLFLNTLYKICRRHLAPLDMMPEFVNMPAHLEDEIQGSKDLVLTTGGGHQLLSSKSTTGTLIGADQVLALGSTTTHSSPYQLVSGKEESDLERLMAQFDYGQNMLTNMEAFSEKLAKELSVLDGANIYSLMGSEDSMNGLVALVDAAVAEVITLEDKLEDWDTCVSSMRGHMEMMDEKDTNLHIIDKNKLAMQQELTSLLEHLEFPAHYKRTLNEVDLNDTDHLKDCIRAAFELEKAITTSQSNFALKKMTAVQEKFSELEALKNAFSKRFLQHMTTLFTKLNNQSKQTSPGSSEQQPSHLKRLSSGAPFGSSEWGMTGLKDLVVRQPLGTNTQTSSGPENKALSSLNLRSKYCMDSLLPYKELVRWLKLASPDVFVDLVKAYLSQFSRSFEKEFRDFFDRVKALVSSSALCPRWDINALTQAGGGPVKSGSARPSHLVNAPTANPVRTGSFRSTNQSSFTSPLSERKRDWLTEINRNTTASSPTSTNTSSSPGSNSAPWDTKMSGGAVAYSFSAILDIIITNVATTITEDQTFVSEFFNLEHGPVVPLPTEIPLQPVPLLVESDQSNPNNLNMTSSKQTLLPIVNTVSPQSIPKSPTIRTDMDDREMLILSFPSLPIELDNFLQAADRTDKYFSVQALVRFARTCIAAVTSEAKAPQATPATGSTDSPATTNREGRPSLGGAGMAQSLLNKGAIGYETEASPFLRLLFINCTVASKRNMDRFMNTIIRGMDETKASKKSKNGGGFLPFVAEFSRLAENLEAIFKRSCEPVQRRELDKWYTILVRSIYNNINRIALEHPKLPRDVVLFENYHSMYTALSFLKISHLEMERKEAKLKYKQHIHSYVESILGKPLEKLNIFFEGIENKVSQGVKESEIGYQIAFSKTELKKVIKEYPGREVKKQLESLYKLVEKHVGEKNSLLQVVWRSVQEEFIKHYKNLDELISKCYPNSQITLEFSLTELLQFFSDIAQQH